MNNRRYDVDTLKALMSHHDMENTWLQGQGYSRICVEKEVFDIVLMDLHMPILDGYAATCLIRETYGPHELFIIAMTANAMREERQKCLDAGMNDYMTKPIDVDSLYAMLLQWVPKKSVDEKMTEKTSASVLDLSVDGLALPETLDGFDLADGLERMLGRPDLYLKFLLKLVQEHADDARIVRESLKQGDRETAHRLTHTVKGVSGNLSAQDLYAAASQLSAAIKQDGDDLEEPLAAFEAELNRAVAAVRSLRKS